MDSYATEIRATVTRLKRTGEFEHYASDVADRVSDEVGAVLAGALELDDSAVASLWSDDAEHSTDLAHDEHARRAELAIRRAQDSGGVQPLVDVDASSNPA